MKVKRDPLNIVAFNFIKAISKQGWPNTSKLTPGYQLPVFVWIRSFLKAAWSIFKHKTPPETLILFQQSFIVMLSLVPRTLHFVTSASKAIHLSSSLRTDLTDLFLSHFPFFSTIICQFTHYPVNSNLLAFMVPVCLEGSSTLLLTLDP